MTRNTVDARLSFFSPNTSRLLINFTKDLANLDCDYVIFMARKALRLYDLITSAGAPKLRSFSYSNHILDQSLDRFKSRTIALIDDTVILGTTLGRAQKLLLDAGAATVSTHAFCVDRDNWCAELVPDLNYCTTFNQQEMLNFCAAEVNALNSAAIPYLTDLPFSRLYHISASQLASLEGLKDWIACDLKNSRRTSDDVIYITFIPTPEKVDQIYGSLPLIHNKDIDLVKVRAFAKRTKTGYWIRYVPILTLQPQTEAAAEHLFDSLVSEVYESHPTCQANIGTNLESAVSKFRFMQYIFSLQIGRHFSNDLRNDTNTPKQLDFDLHESMRHYGRWLRKELIVAHEYVSQPKLLSTTPTRYVAASLPDEVSVATTNDIQNLLPKNVRKCSAFELTQLLSKAFINLYIKRELPARAEVRRLGRASLDASKDQAPLLDRLSYGYAWNVLARQLIPLGTTVTRKRINHLSLMLDSLIDQGIAVPIICRREGIIFRAYRHGEDVLHSEQNISLSYSMLQGFLTGAKASDIQRVVLEKLLVALFRTIEARGLVFVTHSPSGKDASLRICFARFGPVMYLPEDDSVLASRKDRWLSQRLENDGHIVKTASGKWGLGSKPLSANDTPELPLDVESFGCLIGEAFAATERGRQLITTSDLVAMTTCLTARDTCAALATEIRILTTQFDNKLRQSIERLDLADQSAIYNLYAELSDGIAYQALKSAVEKLEAYRSGQAEAAISRCASWFARKHPVLERDWSKWWKPLLNLDDSANAQEFKALVPSIVSSLFDLSLGLAGIQVSLRGLATSAGTLVETRRKSDPTILCHKLFEIMGNPRDDQLKFYQGYVRASAENNLRFGRRLEYSLKWARTRLGDITIDNNAVLSKIQSDGRFIAETRFDFVFWYDIIDSTGRKSGLCGEALEKYGARVTQFKREINAAIAKIRNSAKARGAVVFMGTEHPLSMNDEKHLFICGPGRWEWIRKLFHSVLLACQRYGICVRTVLIPANFTGIDVSAALGPISSEAHGGDFWEHFSLLKKKVKELEAGLNSSTHTSKRSVVWLWEDHMRDKLDPKGSLRWEPWKSEDVETELMNHKITQLMHGHAVAFNYAPSLLAFEEM